MTIVLPSSIASSRFTRAWRRLSSRSALAFRPALTHRSEAVADRQQAQADAVLDPAPEAARQEQREHQRRRAEADEIPDAGGAEPRLDREEDHGAEDRALERAEAADQRHEDHVGGPLQAEIGLRLEGDGGREPQRAGQRRAERGEHEDDPLGARDAHADRLGGLLVVADRLDRRAERAAQQRGRRSPSSADHRGERAPIGERAPRRRA